MTVDVPTDAAAARRRALMRTLERALYDAFADSEELHRTIWDLQREGFQIRLSIACEPGGKPAAERTPPAAADAAAAVFRIDSDDLRFLRSVGIDPTRSRRSRRKA